MPPQPPEPTAPGRRPRHAAEPVPRPFGLGSPAAPMNGRHHRPESLADAGRLRPASAPPSGNRRSVEERFVPGVFEEGFIERGVPEVSRAQRRAAEAIHFAERRRLERLAEWAGPAERPEPRGPTGDRWTEDHRAEGGRTESHGIESHGRESHRPESYRRASHRTESRLSKSRPSESRPSESRHSESWLSAETGRRRAARRADRGNHGTASSRPGGGRGKHAAPSDLAITVRQLPAVREAVVEGLPAAKRAAGAVREWALATGDTPPVVGTHRAPGTLPIESWLLVGRARQQMLLATLVAAGLALVMIPLERHVDVNPIAAADRSIVSNAPGHRAHTKAPAGTAKQPAQHRSDGDPVTSPAQPPAAAASAPPPAAAARPPTPAAPDPPLVAVPPGTGPGQSLRVTGSNAIALTFDDGPDPVQTPKILAMLDKYQIKATFCLIGQNVQKHPEIVQQIVAAGHTLCNHTWNHSLVIGKQRPAQIRADLERTTAAIENAVPGAKVPFFRAPGGNFSDRLVSEAYSEGMTSLHWQVDPRDWDHTTDADDATHTDRVISEIEKAVTPGSIILSHDLNQPDTIAAYEKLLPYLTENFEIGMPVAPPIPADPPSTPAEPPASEAPADPADS
jgi:peptidoglycan/xylan/chitin deacetylase (PgdA/CDA1 family)